MYKPKFLAKFDSAILIAIGAPVIIMAVMFLVLFISRLGINPTIDFVYYSCDSYCYSASYDVLGNKAVDRTRESTSSYSSYSRSADDVYFFLYDMSEGNSEELTFEEVQELTLSGSSRSSEGYSLERSYSGGSFFFPFGSGYSSQWVLASNDGEKPVELEDGSYYDIEFLGWVVE